MKRLRTYIVTGLLVWIPLGFTLFVINVAVGLLDTTLLLLPPDYRPEAILGFRIPGLGLILALTILMITGVVAANFLGRRLVSVGEAIMHRIPLVRTVYSGAKNFAEIVLTDSNQSFKKVLLIQYPRLGVYTLCFQTSDALGEIQAKTGEEVLAVFVPTTPNPTSGFILMVPRKDVIELDMEVETALKMIISLGVVVPEWDESGKPVKLAKVEPTD